MWEIEICNVVSAWYRHRAHVAEQKYLGDGILSRTIDDIVHRPFTADVIHADELEQAGVDEAHTNAIPHVHGS